MSAPSAPTAQEQRAARHIVAARSARTAGERIDPSQRPTNVEQALAVQRIVTRLMLGEPPDAPYEKIAAGIGGWKCSLPNAERSISAAPILASTVQRGTHCTLVPRAGMAAIEPEIAFELARDLPPRELPYSEAEVRAAIGDARLVLELIASRYVEPVVSFPEMLADHVSNQGLYVGPVVQNGVDLPLARIELSVSAGTTSLEKEGKHPDGNPLLPLYWLANFLSTSGQGLRAGQIVTTGSYAGIVTVPLGTTVTVRFGDLGSIETLFEAVA
jgi:2-keto-4-pentenoate hydratase